MFRLSLRIGLCCFVMIFFAASLANASPYLEVYSVAKVRFGDGSVVGPDASNYSEPASGGLGSIDVSVTAGTGSAQARASYGKLGISEIDPSPGYTNSRADFSDVWKISNALKDGQYGKLHVTVSLEGIIAPLPRTSVYVDMYSGSLSQRIINVNGLGTISNTGSIPGVTSGSFDLTFKFGQAFDIAMTLAGATADGGLIYLYDTAWITGLDVYDLSNNAVTSYQLTATSGQDYGFGGNPTAAPEPVTMLLLGLGIVGLAGVKRFNS